MRYLKSIAAAAAVSVGALSFATAADAGPRRGWGPGPYHGPVVVHRHNNGGAVAAGIIGGLAVGTILGSALSAPRYAAPPAYGAVPVYDAVPVYGPAPWSPDWYAYCASKYRSFDAASGTYLGYDGRRHLCQ